jgi:hypothetical protein
MLFDLTGRGRKRFVRVIYLGLAILMGAGLLLFGIGTGGDGGLIDAFNSGGSDTSAQVSNAEKRANRVVRLKPRDPEAWADLTRARYQTAGLGDNFDQETQVFTEDGREKLASAAAAWKRYLALDPPRVDATLARLMANAYSEAGLDNPPEAAAAMEIVTEEQPSAASYATLAQLAYLADQMRKGDLAAAKAVELAPAAQRRVVRGQLEGARRDILRQRAEAAVQQGAAAGG